VSDTQIQPQDEAAAAGAARPSNAAPSVVVDGVWKRFGSTDVVADLSSDVRPGEILGFLGPNGAGKITTMRMILDIIRPDRGTISVFGELQGIQHQSRTVPGGSRPTATFGPRDAHISVRCVGCRRRARERARELLPRWASLTP
jgi:ABC-type polysaccharide/polyol phosphate transport system ATPase subunit